MNNIIKANKYDIEAHKTIKFSPYKETICLSVTKDDCELLKTGKCPIFTKKGTGNCTEILEILKANDFTQEEGHLPDVVYNKKENYYTVNGGQHRMCIASILQMDIMINKKISEGIGENYDYSPVIVEKGVPRENLFSHDRDS